jgi:hypothetical protein
VSANKSIQYLSTDSCAAAPELLLAGYCGLGWYFWNESFDYVYGPYGSEKEAEDALGEYCREFLGDPQ